MSLTDSSLKRWDVREAFRSPLPQSFCKQEEKIIITLLLKNQKNINLQGYPLSGVSLWSCHLHSQMQAVFQSVWQVLAVKGWLTGVHLAAASALLVTDQHVDKADSALLKGRWGIRSSSKSLACQQLCPRGGSVSSRAILPGPSIEDLPGPPAIKEKRAIRYQRPEFISLVGHISNVTTKTFLQP